MDLGARGQNAMWLSGVQMSQAVTKRAGCLCQFMIQLVNYLLEYSAHPTEAPKLGSPAPGPHSHSQAGLRRV